VEARAGQNAVKRQKKCALVGNRAPGIQSVATPTELSRLPYYNETNVLTTTYVIFCVNEEQHLRKLTYVEGVANQSLRTAIVHTQRGRAKR
jgi:hypothetical protein